MIALVARLLHLLVTFFLDAFERPNHRPRSRIDLRIVHRGLIVDRVDIDHRQTLDDSHGVAVKLPFRIEPGPAVEIGRLDDQRIPLPVAAAVSHPQFDVGPDMRTAVRVDDAIDMTPGLVDDGYVSRKLSNLTRTKVCHLPGNARGKTLRVGIDVVGDILVPLRPRPRLIRNSSVWRIDDRRDRRPKATRGGVTGKIFDILKTHRHRCLPNSLQVRLAVRRLGRIERLGFPQRAGMKACGGRRTTSRDGVGLRPLAGHGHRRQRQGNRQSRRCNRGAREPVFQRRASFQGPARGHVALKTKSTRTPGFGHSFPCDDRGACSSSRVSKTLSGPRWWLRS